MKKQVMAVAMLAIFSVSTFGCGRKNDSSVSSEVFEGGSRQRAIETIRESVGNVEVVEDNAYFPKDLVVGMVAECGQPGITYKVWYIDVPVQEPYEIAFLFDGDSKVVWAEESQRDFIGSKFTIQLDYQEEQYHTNNNFNGNSAFAWNYCGSANAVIGCDDGYICSSVWAINKDTSSVSLVWHNAYFESEGYGA